VGECNDKPGSLTVTARISRSVQTPGNLLPSKYGREIGKLREQMMPEIRLVFSGMR